MVKLGDVTTIVTGTTPKTSIDEYWNGDYNWVTPAELDDTTFIINETKRKITDKAIKETSLKILPVGTVLLSSRAPIGKVAIVGVEMYCNQGFKNLICSENIYNKYLFWFLKGKTEFLNSLGRGATFKEISKTIVENIQIPLPPLEIQKQIAKTLDTTAELLAMRKQQLTELDNLIKSTFYEMFGDPVMNEKGWETEKLVDFAILVNGRAYKQNELLENGKTPVLRVGNFFSNKDWYYSDLVLEENKYCDEGDLLYAWSASFGPKIWKGPKVIYHYHIWKILLSDEVDKLFMFSLLKYLTDNLKANTHGIAMMHLTKSGMEKTKFILPPLTLQNKFATIVTKIEEQKDLVKKAIDETQYLFDSLMSQYFD